MQRYLERYTNPENGEECFKRLSVLEDDGFFRVVKETYRGYGTIVIANMPIRPYITRKGAEKAMMKWQPKQYKMTLVEGLMQEGKI
ncbi:hypothetical protein PS2_134 [Serratia phage PS2]|uniref:Uncharacterized protein n=1 Tax=Serratia phage PS2 TaxID=1481112 RepID=A0A023W543_9CAUD|nr:hypothetical protein FF83_gp134 [Serratia phage PS2]AHY25380.1 hypothetical protein PS2_134 [Serratia phage PS2]